MLVRVPALLSPDQVAHCRTVLEGADWIDGRATAGTQSAGAKHNLQVPEDSPEARGLGQMILGALGRNETFVSAALPLRVFPPLFNRYDAGMKFDAHVDNAIRFTPPSAGSVRVRTDISCTLFLSDPGAYDGGELTIKDSYGDHAVKLPAGDLVVYPASSLHRVAPITRGSRWASFFWCQSMVRDDGQRSLLFGLDRSIGETREALGDGHHGVVGLTSAYHNLLRMWADA